MNDVGHILNMFFSIQNTFCDSIDCRVDMHQNQLTEVKLQLSECRAMYEDQNVEIQEIKQRLDQVKAKNILIITPYACDYVHAHANIHSLRSF